MTTRPAPHTPHAPRAYYNESDPFAAAWLRALIAAGEIMDGEVDERDIRDVCPGELGGFTQHHFFAGIGGWSLALRLAEWPDDRPVWTGSCPCQPFSAAGKGAGVADERHLWPDWHWLIEQCRPRVVFGEQVEAAVRHGWLDLVHADLEGSGYACGAVGVPAAGVGAFHQRARIWFVAERLAVAGSQLEGRGLSRSAESLSADRPGAPDQSGGSGSAGKLADARRGADERRGGSHPPPAAPGSFEGEVAQRQRGGATAGAGGASGGVAESHDRFAEDGRVQRGGRHLQRAEDTAAGLVGDSPKSRRARLCWQRQAGTPESSPDDRVGDSRRARLSQRPEPPDQPEPLRYQGATAGASEPLRTGFWSSVVWISCRDGKHRPVEPGIFPLVDGLRSGRVAVGRAVQQARAALSPEDAAHEFSRVGTLRGAGNAIVPQVAAEVIAAYMDLRGIAQIPPAEEA